jgi:transposase
MIKTVERGGLMPKRIPEERKRKAVKMVVKGSLLPAALAEQLGMGQSTVEKTVNKFRELQPEELTLSEHEELRRLRRDVAELRTERDILKKPPRTSRRSSREIRLYQRAGIGQAEHPAVLPSAGGESVWLGIMSGCTESP